MSTYALVVNKNIFTLKIELDGLIHTGNFSKEVISASCLTSFKNDIDSNSRVHCNYINFWIVHALINVLNKEEHFSNIIDTIKGFSQAFVEIYKCKCNFSKTFNNNNFNKIKAVHDYFNDYTYINGKLNESSNLFDEAYKRYLEKKINVYETACNERIQRNTQSYCDELKE
ncbi:PIR Superfamily Protein [Plasmodium ovale wallikeri]|uniref:PIR Superfamily Protein n=1 Tax=Plasmodium ovale wallikeri TaxID=864142 RepID=A0A1A9ALT1_PLAOA|nr:PIR Superfamily Protein [Plasmodium ovale wallikeri]SBT57730.1 PIR Superfamily Protein [Plasmodium ovale wallikeri]